LTFDDKFLFPEKPPPPKEFVSQLETLKKAVELDFSPTPGFGPLRAIMPSESVSHPAKMNLRLLTYLVENYTRPGETVLDPMSGTFSTSIVAALNGRNAIGVELEEKFVKWGEKARERLEAIPSLTETGRITVIKGDARYLSTLLASADTVMTSPPFSDTLHPRKGVLQAQENMRGAGYDEKYIRDSFQQPNQQLALAKDGYGSDPANLGNLKHGEVDTAIFSPPYTSATGGGAKGIAEKGYNGKHGRDATLQHRNDRPISDDPAQISNLPMGEEDVDAIVTSPPYKTRTDGGGLNETGMPNARGIFKEKPGTLEYSEDKEGNIGEIKEHGEVDAVVTSPPYAESIVMSFDSPQMHAYFEKMLKEKGHIEFEGKRYTEKEWRAMNHGRLDGRTTKGLEKGSVGYSPARENIGNLPHVDSVVTSPPYAQSAGRQDDRDEFFDKLAKDPTSARFGRESHPRTGAAYSQSEENIGNAPVDSILTSPPFGDSVLQDYGESNKALLEWERGIRKELAETGFIAHDGRKYTEAEWRAVNKGELKPRGMPDLWAKIIANRASQRYNDADPDNIGNLPVDSVVTSPPYEKSEAFEDTDFVKKISGDLDVKILNGEAKGHLKARSAKYKSGAHASREHAPSAEAEVAYLERAEKGRVENPGSIGKLERETYLAAMFRVYGEMMKVLKPGGRAVIVIKPFARDHKVVDLPWQTWLLLEKVGFHLEDLLKLRLRQMSFWRILYYRKFPAAERIVHEYAIVVRKGALSPPPAPPLREERVPAIPAPDLPDQEERPGSRDLALGVAWAGAPLAEWGLALLAHGYATSPSRKTITGPVSNVLFPVLRQGATEVDLRAYARPGPEDYPAVDVPAAHEHGNRPSLADVLGDRPPPRRVAPDLLRLRPRDDGVEVGFSDHEEDLHTSRACPFLTIKSSADLPFGFVSTSTLVPPASK